MEGFKFLSLFVLLAAAQGFEKLNVTIYYESECYYSTQFLRKYFSPYWLPLQYYINLTLVPFGKANWVSDTELDCQNGPVECALNKMMACAIKHSHDYNEVMPFILCLQGGDQSMLNFCAETLRMNFNTLQSCISGSEGIQLMKHMEALTQQVKTSKFGLPTIVVNGEQHTGMDEDFWKKICKKLPSDLPSKPCNWFDEDEQY